MTTRPFIHDDFLLSTPTARRLYHEFAVPEPILDYHCHLSPRDIAENRQFKNLFEIWLEGDHYKWRAMRANGVPERFCTGDATPWEKFKAWAATVPHTLRNPLYHWTHLELTRYFGITELLNEDSAERIWEQANEQLATPEFSTQGILQKFRVTTLCTTDDPVDDLLHHEAIARSGLATRVLPAFRPDAALAVHRPEFLNAWLMRLEQASSRDISKLPALLEALRQRGDFFHEHGCRLSDHGLDRCYAEPCNDAEAAAIFDAARCSQAASPAAHAKFASYLMHFLGCYYAERGWTMQLHLGALRNNNTRLLHQLGPDTGFDSIGDTPQAAALGAFLDRLDQDNALPNTILYNLNPADNYALATMAGNFQDGSVPGKVQLGSGWWFLDQKEAMEWQLNALSNLGLLSRFVGMVTDSRSFMSYPRHEYFRRVLCNLIGRDMEAGEIPDDFALAGGMVRNICHDNARQYLSLPITSKAVILMGVTGTGKSTAGRLLARKLGACFFDADDFHSPDNLEKLSAGIPLTDEDRRAWLERLRDAIHRESAHWPLCVAACSALKGSYRDLLSEAAQEVRFVHLTGSRELLAERISARTGHFMNPALLESQIATLEAPPDALALDVSKSPEVIAGTIIRKLGLEPRRSAVLK